ncbi:MAG: hypothetical protein J2P30_15570 [Actinobacteria bacterium]|nr:hypothetical protein [Actinomycetota bacterium]
MRVVLRVLLFEFSLAWALLLAGSARVTAQLWPFFTQTIGAGWRDRWRVRTGWLIGIPIAAGWPLLFWLGQARNDYHHWLQAIAIPWWIVFGGYGLRLLLARVSGR